MRSFVRKMFGMAELIEMTPGDLRRLASRIEYVANKYRDVAAEMESRKLASVPIKGIKTISNEILRRLASNANSAEMAVYSAELDELGGANDDDMRAVAEAEERFTKKKTPRKKKK